MKLLWLSLTLFLMFSVACAKKKKFEGDFEFVDEVGEKLISSSVYMYNVYNVAVCCILYGFYKPLCLLMHVCS